MLLREGRLERRERGRQTKVEALIERLSREGILAAKHVVHQVVIHAKTWLALKP